MRYPDWQARLVAYLSATAALIQEPGVHDCALFPAGAVEAMTGVDLAADWRGTYSSFEEGLNALKAAGFADHIDLVARHFAEIAPAFAQAGDLAVVDGLLGPSLGVVQGEGIYVLTVTRMGRHLERLGSRAGGFGYRRCRGACRKIGELGLFFGSGLHEKPARRKSRFVCNIVSQLAIIGCEGIKLCGQDSGWPERGATETDLGACDKGSRSQDR